MILFMEREDLPSEDEQYETYSAVARAFGEKPVIIRTLDVGGESAAWSSVQYTLAADRGNERLRRLQNADHPAVVQLIRQICEAANGAGIRVGVCGEAAGEPQMIPGLLDLGITELSMSAPSIPRAKKLVSEYGSSSPA